MNRHLRDGLRKCLDVLRRLASALLVPTIILVAWIESGPHLLQSMQNSISQHGWIPVTTFVITVYLVLRLMRNALRLTSSRSYSRSVSTLSASPAKARALDALAERVAQENVIDEVQVRKARHEAAHALVAYLRGAKVDHLDLVVTGDHGGRCVWDIDMQVTSVIESAWMELLNALAGNETDLAAGWRDGGSRSDMSAALGACAAILSTGDLPAGVQCEPSTDALMAAGRAQVRLMLTEHADFAEEIAQRLLSSPGFIWNRPDLASLKGAPKPM